MAFYPNCTHPTTTTAYVGSATVRSTLDILWTSLGTIIACTYSVLHLNVPKQRPGRRARVWPSFKWSIITILAPELILVKSLGDWAEARTQLRKLHRARPETKGTWQLSHMLFAEMGGFVVTYRDVPSQRRSAKAGEQRENSTAGELEESNHSGIREAAIELRNATHDVENPPLSMVRRPADQNSYEGEPHRDTLLEQSSPRTFHLAADSLRCAVIRGLLPIQVVPVEEIWDRSKSTLFTKLLALAQTLYFLLEFLVRLGRGLPTTPLEVGVVGFVVCSAVTYAFALPKPKDVTTCITLKAYESELPGDFEKVFNPSACLWSDHRMGEPIPNDSGMTLRGDYYLVMAGTLLGAIHLGGWNLIFPSLVDMWLWRSAALISTAGLPLLFLLVLLDEYKEIPWFQTCMTGLWIFAYPASRLVLIVEMFRCLTHLPPGAFITTWTSNIPHIG